MTREELGMVSVRFKRATELVALIKDLDGYIKGLSDEYNFGIHFSYYNKDKEQVRCNSSIIDVPDDIFAEVFYRHILAGLNELRDKYQKEFDEL